MSAEVSSPLIVNKRPLDDPSPSYSFGGQPFGRRMQSSPVQGMFPQMNLKRSFGCASPEYESNRSKRLRTSNFHSSEADVEQSAFGIRHQAESSEFQRQAEMMKLKEECQQHLIRKDAEVHALKQENQRLTGQLEEAGKVVERLTEQTTIFKRVVAIQNQQKQEVSAENETVKKLLQDAIEHIKRLEQTNYTLRVYLQSNGASINSFDQGPPPPSVH